MDSGTFLALSDCLHGNWLFQDVTEGVTGCNRGCDRGCERECALSVTDGVASRTEGVTEVVMTCDRALQRVSQGMLEGVTKYDRA